MKQKLFHIGKRTAAILLSVLLSVLCLTASPAVSQKASAAEALLVTGGHSTYLSGYSGGYFKPEAAMTRAEVAQMLYNLLAQKPAVSGSGFADVTLNAWYGTAVNSLALSGVLKGYKDGTFLPNGTITRAEFVTALTQCFPMEEGDVSFSDVPETSWAYKYIRSACAKGWLNGYKDGTFRPNQVLKRCEAVKIVNVALGRKDNGFAADRNEQKFRDVPKDHWAFLEIAEAAKPAGGGETEEPPQTTEIKVGSTVYVTASALNLREGPSTSTASLAVLQKGTALTVTQLAESPWIGVTTPDGKKGYVSSVYVAVEKPSASSGLKLSASNLSLAQYQTVRLDASVSSGSISDTKFSTSDPNVAVVGYTVNYNTYETGAMVYGKTPGTATITLSSGDGKTKVSCTVQVMAAQAVRYAYSDRNVAPLGAECNLVAITDGSREKVKFQIVDGPANGSYETSSYTTASQNSKHGLPTNQVRIFKRAVSFERAGLYTIRAFSDAGSGYSSDHYEFTVLVSASSSGSFTETDTSSRRASSEIIKVLANFEGMVSEVEDDRLATKNPTVAYGYVVPVNGAFYNTVTSEEAMAFLVNTVNKQTYASSVEKFRAANSLKMSQAQFDALVSFTYNLGPGELNAGYDTFKTLLNAVVPPSDLSDDPREAKVNVSISVPLYQDSAWTSTSLATVKSGATVTVIGAKFLTATHQMWYHVNVGGKTGWMPAGYIKLSSGGTSDLAYTDATSFAYNYLQWCHASGKMYEGLVWRRLAECKIFLFGNYDEAYHSSANYTRNTYGFLYPEECRSLDRR